MLVKLGIINTQTTVLSLLISLLSRMATRTKYKAKPVFFDIELRGVLDSNLLEKYRVKGRLKLPESIVRFDSQHEFKVYLELCRMYGTERVTRQYLVKISLPGYCYPTGKSWKIDFAIADPDPFSDFTYYVEAKGAFLPEFAQTLASFESRSAESFERLIIVFGDSIPLNNRVVKSLFDSPFKSNLLTLKELEQLKTLP